MYYPHLKVKRRSLPKVSAEGQGRAGGDTLASPCPMSPAHFHGIDKLPAGLAHCLQCDITEGKVLTALSQFIQGDGVRNQTSLCFSTGIPT